MSKYITSVVFLGAFLVAAPLAFAYENLFAEWRREQGATYGEGYLLSSAIYSIDPCVIYKGGNSGATDGNLYTAGRSALTIERNYQGSANQFWINAHFYFSGPKGHWYDYEDYDGQIYYEFVECPACFPPDGYVPYVRDFGIALVGDFGLPAILPPIFPATGLMANVSFEINGTWYTLGSLLYGQASSQIGANFEYQCYLGYEKVAPPVR